MPLLVRFMNFSLQFLAVLVRIFALWGLIMMLDALARRLEVQISLQDLDFFSISNIWLTAVVFFIAYNAYRFPLRIARVLLRDGEAIKSSQEPMNPLVFFPVGRCLVGLWFLNNNLSLIFSSYTLLHGNQSANAMTSLVGASVTSICGAVLVAGWPRARPIE